MDRCAGDPGRCLEEVNRQLCTQVFSGQFVTMILAVLDLDQGVMDVANAGHPPPLIAEGAQFETLNVRPQLVLGIDSDVSFPTERFALSGRSSIVLYTDGAVEAVAPGGQRYSIEGLRDALGGAYGSGQALLDDVVKAVNAFRRSAPLADDLTVVAIQVQEIPQTQESDAVAV
jgi:sigma-B regulation protein RsbU (phosphoserine phosphatase)